MFHIQQDDPEIAALIEAEKYRIENTLNLIAAENHAPVSIMETLGSVFNAKTIEGYPGKRFHAGCVNADQVENIAVARAKKLFAAEYANVQPHSGTSANLAVYFSVLEVGDRILSMNLPHGGHLSHGHRASITSKCFQFAHYGVDKKSGLIDYEEVRRVAQSFRPKMIVAGASSYPRLIDYAAIAKIATDVSAYFFTDMAHIAGLVAAKAIPSPVPHCDFVTFTCYKTLQGGRGGVILCREKYGKKIDRTIFPGCQGTSAVNSIAAKALIFKLATEPKFVRNQKQTLENAVCLSFELEKKGYRIVTGGTENHQVLVDLRSKGLTGNRAQKRLEAVGIITNRNVVPDDAENSVKVSGLRLGTSAVTTQGMKTKEMIRVADLIDSALIGPEGAQMVEKLSVEVKRLCRQFPVYP
jgi:glycine hydroxymethyltransferase